MQHLWLPLILISLTPVHSRVDLTRQSKAHGGPVTTASIKMLQDTCIFQNDHQFMRRLAWVSSNFGDKSDAFSGSNKNKGIWGLSEENFNKIGQSLTEQSRTVSESKARLNLDPIQFSWPNGDLMVPLNGALATRTVLDLIDSDIPWTIEDQATYWANNYVSGRTAKDFLDAVGSMPASCEAAGADVLFMLDSSGSICQSRNYECNNYKTMKTFVKGVINSLPFGPRAYKWAVDVFDSTPTHPIRFNSYSDDLQSLLNKVDALRYLNGGTRTDLALLQAVDKSFSTGYGARNPGKGYPKVVILITDGLSNEPEKTKIATQIAKQNGLVLFTVGIGQAFNGGQGPVELKYIASYPKCMHMYLLQDFKALLQGFTAELRQQTCGSSSVFAVGANQTLINNLVAKDKYMYFEFQANSSRGMTLDLGMKEGAATLYISQEDRNPSEVIYDYKIEADTGKNGQIYIGPKELNATTGAVLMQDAVLDESKGTVPVYGAIKGEEQSNNFTIRISEGDALNSGGKMTVSWILLAILGFFVLFVNFSL